LFSNATCTGTTTTHFAVFSNAPCTTAAAHRHYAQALAAKAAAAAVDVPAVVGLCTLNQVDP
jgi:hypothetical protein